MPDEIYCPMNKFILIVIVLIVCTAIFLFFNYSSRSTDRTQMSQGISGTLQIIRSGWSEKQPSAEVTSQTPEKDKKIILAGMSTTDNYTLTIVDSTEEEVHLVVDGLSLQQGEANGINLKGCTPQNFTLKRGEQATLDTCTMDAGIEWTITYVK